MSFVGAQGTDCNQPRDFRHTCLRFSPQAMILSAQADMVMAHPPFFPRWYMPLSPEFATRVVSPVSVCRLRY